ncbi:MAG: hypothetical protein ACTHU0_22125 [Kofleriaceae bacterium]
MVAFGKWDLKILSLDALPTAHLLDIVLDYLTGEEAYLARRFLVGMRVITTATARAFVVPPVMAVRLVDAVREVSAETDPALKIGGDLRREDLDPNSIVVV